MEAFDEVPYELTYESWLSVACDRFRFRFT